MSYHDKIEWRQNLFLIGRILSFRQKVENLDFVIYEGHAGVGGTWFANRYPVSLNLLTIFVYFASYDPFWFIREFNVIFQPMEWVSISLSTFKRIS